MQLLTEPEICQFICYPVSDRDPADLALSLDASLSVNFFLQHMIRDSNVVTWMSLQ